MSAIAVFGGGYPTERGNVRGEGTCPAFMDSWRAISVVRVDTACKQWPIRE